MLRHAVSVVAMLLVLCPAIAAATPPASPVAATGPFDGLVDVGGRRLHLQCTGAGGPTVVLESGLNSDHTAWTSVVAGIVGVGMTRVCAYDRAGLGRSDPAPTQPRNLQAAVDDLHTLLVASGEPGPFVLVGASIGGMIVRLFASQHPEDVAGLVLVDGSPGWFWAANALLPTAEIRAADERETRGLAVEEPERYDLFAADGLLVSSPMPPRVPTVVLTHDTFAHDVPPDWSANTIARLDKLWRNMQEVQAEELLGQLVVAAGSGHDIANERPDLVIEAIQRVVAAVHDPGTWATPAASPMAGTPTP